MVAVIFSGSCGLTEGSEAAQNKGKATAKGDEPRNGWCTTSHQRRVRFVVHRATGGDV
jgi:hypothetical protein